MLIQKHLRLATAVAAFSILAASPALAQGKGKGNGKNHDKGRDRGAAVQQQRQRPTLQRRTDSDRAETRTADRYPSRTADRYPTGTADRYPSRTADRYPSRTADRYPDRNDDRYDDRWEDRESDGRRRGVPPGWCQGRGNPHNTPENCGYSSRGRYDGRYENNDRYGSYGSYTEAHAAFHRQLDRKYSELGARRRTDLIYQVRLRAEKAAEHDRWHERTGTRH